MFTIKLKTRIQEGASWEDIESGDYCYEIGYEIYDEDGDMIYDFADKDIMREFDEANRKEIANSAANAHPQSNKKELGCGVRVD